MILTIVMTAILTGFTLGTIGFYVYRMRVVTLSFSVAHVALAGASIGLVIGFDPTYGALSSSLASSLLLGLLSSRASYGRELLSMALFSASSSLALLSIYLSNVRVLATSEVASILWGSLLAATPEKVIAMSSLLLVLSGYVSAFRLELSSIMFDRRLAEAEGVRVTLHTTLMVTICGLAIALALKVTGGFLVFSLLYNPVAASLSLLRSDKHQPVASAIIGVASSLSGLWVSYSFDLPVGASVSLFSVILLAILKAVSEIKERVIRARSK
ncbi:MAG: metal ABC transporter permease [Candidatus Korarchaeum sp.]|nr:metal ABC transporter permease [Candidatus Korarchaeum sp.]MDW8035186.1 metal ABC transporter permease [Candidatus Korarchaeum sp.]